MSDPWQFLHVVKYNGSRPLAIATSSTVLLSASVQLSDARLFCGRLPRRSKLLNKVRKWSLFLQDQSVVWLGHLVLKNWRITIIHNFNRLQFSLNPKLRYVFHLSTGNASPFCGNDARSTLIITTKELLCYRASTASAHDRWNQSRFSSFPGYGMKTCPV